MSLNKIAFINIEVRPKINKRKVRSWLKEATLKYNKKIGQINYIFCKDEYLLKINNDFLNHNYLTDIITFDLRDDNLSNILEADIYISAERVEDNAKANQETIEKETLRVIIHGVLHLCGLNDKNKNQKEQMKKSENELIELYNAMFHVE